MQNKTYTGEHRERGREGGGLIGSQQSRGRRTGEELKG
jgi:hypothetical protein